MKSLLKKCFIYSRNLLIWLSPFFIFSIVLFMLTVFTKRNISNYIEILKILIWPVTVLIALFFFRKVVTYLFFSMDEFNFFGIKGELKNVRQLIDEEVQKQLEKEKKELSDKEKLKKLEKKINDKSNSIEENKKIARDIYDLYISYKNDTEKQIEELIKEKQKLKERYIKVSRAEGVIPLMTDKTIDDLGTGEKILNLQGMQPENYE